MEHIITALVVYKEMDMRMQMFYNISMSDGTFGGNYMATCNNYCMLTWHLSILPTQLAIKNRYLDHEKSH